MTGGWVAADAQNTVARTSAHIRSVKANCGGILPSRSSMLRGAMRKIIGARYPPCSDVQHLNSRRIIPENARPGKYTRNMNNLSRQSLLLWSRVLRVRPPETARIWSSTVRDAPFAGPFQSGWGFATAAAHRDSDRRITSREGKGM